MTEADEQLLDKIDVLAELLKAAAVQVESVDNCRVPRPRHPDDIASERNELGLIAACQQQLYGMMGRLELVHTRASAFSAMLQSFITMREDAIDKNLDESGAIAAHRLAYMFEKFNKAFGWAIMSNARIALVYRVLLLVVEDETRRYRETAAPGQSPT